MNSKFLYAATIAVSLISTLAMADEAPLTRTQVNAELSKAIADGTLQRTDYDTGNQPVSASSLTRDQVSLAFVNAKAAKKSLNGSDASSSYNPFGAAIHASSTVTRADVKADVRQAAADGTLHRSDYDENVQVARRAKVNAAAPSVAQRTKSVSAQSAS
jgi:hypothetical protein